jgi:DNA polymerase-1
MPRRVRRRAKAINFGIIYGISAFGLANQLGIEREEAGDYIKNLFRALPGHPRLHGRDARPSPASNGYVSTIFGRKIHFPNAIRRATRRARLRRARLDQRPDPGHGRRHHPPRHDPHGAGAGRRPGCRSPHAAAGA